MILFDLILLTFAPGQYLDTTIDMTVNSAYKDTISWTVAEHTTAGMKGKLKLRLQNYKRVW